MMTREQLREWGPLTPDKARAYPRGRSRKRLANNTTLEKLDAGGPHGTCYCVKLHGHGIVCIRSRDGLMQIRDAGWPTATTADRLRCLAPVAIYRTQGKIHASDGRQALSADDIITICPGRRIVGRRLPH